jgi:peptidoglycan-associated lipoprotein
MIHCVRAFVVLIFALLPASLFAQGSPGRDGAAAAAGAATLLGDTGLWSVPAADVLPAGTLNAGVLRGSEPRGQTSTNASYWAASLAGGLGNRAEVFGAWQMTGQVDHRRGSGDLVGGVKVNLLSERRGALIGLAVRSAVKVPAGDRAAGLSTGEPDLLTELVASRQLGIAQIAAAAGPVWRRDTADGAVPNGVRSGVGVALMAQRSLRIFMEVHGETYRGSEGGEPLVSAFDQSPAAAAGVSWTFANSMSVGAGVSRAIGSRGETSGLGALVRLGYRPALRPSRPAPTLLPPSRPVSATTPAGGIAPPPAAPLNAGAGIAPGAVVLEDVQFQLDRATLLPQALRVLDAAAAALLSDPALRLRIEGHTCEFGTNEYNVALGQRRAHAVRDYLVSRGVGAERLETLSLGEERPKHDLRTEATRALNRRAELHPVTTTTR